MQTPHSQVQLLRLHYQLETDWQQPAFMGSRLRGMFGHSLRQQVCTQPGTACQSCPKIQQCAYPQVFEALPQGTQQMPPAFVLQPPPMGEHRLAAGDSITFTQVLFQPALPWLSSVLLAWQNATFEHSQSGIRLQRAEFTDLNGTTLSTWQPGQPIPAPSPVDLNLPEPGTQNRITLQFITPLRLREQGHDIRPKNLQARHLVMAAIRRLKLLAPSLAAQLPMADLSPTILQSWAQSLQLEGDLHWYELQRWSNRQKKEVPISGIIGTATLSGNLQPFLPALGLLPITGLGKHGNHGLGQTHIVTDQPSL